MEFRWVIFLTLWTLLIGPVFDVVPSAQPQAPKGAKTMKTKSKNAR